MFDLKLGLSLAICSKGHAAGRRALGHQKVLVLVFRGRGSLIITMLVGHIAEND